MKHLISLSIADMKVILRSPALRGFMFLPILLFALIIWFLPGLVDRYPNIAPFVPVFILVGIIENTQLFSFISSLVFVDEKETEVNKVYGIVPLNSFEFLASRLTIPFLFTVLLNLVLLALQPFFQIGFLENLVISFVSALVVPVYVLGINIFARNRMQALVYIKVFNIIVLLPLAAFFIQSDIRFIFSVLPTYYVFKGADQMIADLPYLGFAAAATLYLVILLFVTARFFLKKHFV